MAQGETVGGDHGRVAYLTIARQRIAIDGLTIDDEAHETYFGFPLVLMNLFWAEPIDAGYTTKEHHTSFVNP